jgi:hypothetical protein
VAPQYLGFVFNKLLDKTILSNSEVKGRVAFPAKYGCSCILIRIGDRPMTSDYSASDLSPPALLLIKNVISELDDNSGRIADFNVEISTLATAERDMKRVNATPTAPLNSSKKICAIL